MQNHSSNMYFGNYQSVAFVEKGRTYINMANAAGGMVKQEMGTDAPVGGDALGQLVNDMGISFLGNDMRVKQEASPVISGTSEENSEDIVATHGHITLDTAECKFVQKQTNRIKTFVEQPK